MITPQQGQGASYKALHCLIDDNLLNRNTLFTEAAPAAHQGAFLKAFQTAAVATGQRDGLNQRIVANLTFIIVSIYNPKEITFTDHPYLGDLRRSKLLLHQLSELLQANWLGNELRFVCTHPVCIFCESERQNYMAYINGRHQVIHFYLLSVYMHHLNMISIYTQFRMKILTIAICLALFTLGQCQLLGNCIDHILHESGNEDFECVNNEKIHFFSTYVLPDGAYRCLEKMKGKQGFYISTVKKFDEIFLSQTELVNGKISRKDFTFKGWKCDNQGLVKSTNFKGFQLFISTCKHQQDNFENFCIIKGWPLEQLSDETL